MIMITVCGFFTFCDLHWIFVNFAVFLIKRNTTDQLDLAFTIIILTHLITLKNKARVTEINYIRSNTKNSTHLQT